MAAYEAYSAVFFNHFIINGLQKSLFCPSKGAILPCKRACFETVNRWFYNTLMARQLRYGVSPTTLPCCRHLFIVLVFRYETTTKGKPSWSFFVIMVYRCCYKTACTALTTCRIPGGN